MSILSDNTISEKFEFDQYQAQRVWNVNGAMAGFLLATFLWGLTFVFIKESIRSIDPVVFIFYRFLIASIVIAIGFPKLFFSINRTVIHKSSLLGICLTGTVLFQTIGLQNSKASVASFITGTAIIYVCLINAFITKKLPSIKTFTGVLLSVIGLLCVTWEPGFNINISDVWLIICSILFGCYLYFSKLIQTNEDVMSITFINMCIITCFTFCMILIQHKTFSLPPFSYQAYAGLLYCSIIASVIAFSLQLKCQKYISPQKAGICFSLEPVFATISAVIVLNETLHLSFWVGAFMIGLSIFILE